MQSDVVTNVKTPFCFETEGPCENVLECSADTVTGDMSARVENVTPVTLGVTFARCQELKAYSSIDGGEIGTSCSLLGIQFSRKY